MKTTARNTAPLIEALLASVHRDLEVLQERRGALLRSGIDSDHLPGEPDLMAFALLGDHERDKQLERLASYWSELQSKGLTYGALDDASTSVLRLLASVLPHIETIGTLWQRLQDADQVPEPPHGILRCATRVRGLWGQLARLHFVAQDVQHMLIAPDTTFGLHPALVAAEPGNHMAGQFEFPIDNGTITLSLLHRSGEVFRHVVHAIVEEMN